MLSPFLPVVSRICTDYVKGRYFKEGTRYDSFNDDDCELSVTQRDARGRSGAAYSARAQVLQAECESLLDNLLIHLSSDERALVKLFYWQGMRYAEIAALVGISASEVGKKLHRARTALRDMLRKRGIKNFKDLWE